MPTKGEMNSLGQRWTGSAWVSSADYRRLVDPAGYAAATGLNQTTIPTVTSPLAGATVTQKVILYSPNGGTITVDPGTVNTLLAQGWLTSPLANPTKPYATSTIPTGTVIVPPTTSLEPGLKQPTTIPTTIPTTVTTPVQQTVKLNTGELVDQTTYNKMTPIQKQYLTTSGIDAFNNKQQQVLFVLGTPNADGGYSMEQLNTALRKVDLADLGLVGFDVAEIEKQLEDYKQGYLESVKASAVMTQLAPYKVTQPFIGPIPKDQERPQVIAGYDLRAALANGVKPELLVAAGFAQKDIQAAQAANNKPVQSEVRSEVRSEQKKPTDKTTVEYWVSKGFSPEAAEAEAEAAGQMQLSIGGTAVGSTKPETVTKPDSVRPPTDAEWSLMLANMEYAGYSADAPKKIDKMVKQWEQWFKLSDLERDTLERRGVVASTGLSKGVMAPETAQMLGGVIPFAQARTLPDYIASTLMVATPFIVESFGRVSGAIGESDTVGRVVHPSEIERAVADNPELASLGKTKTVTTTTDSGIVRTKLSIPEHNIYKLIDKGVVTPEFEYSSMGAAAKAITRLIESDVKGNSYGFTRAVESFGRDAVKAAYPNVNIDAILKSESALRQAKELSLQRTAQARTKALSEKLWDRAVGVREATGAESTTVSNYGKSQFRAEFAKKGYVLSDPEVNVQVGELINKIMDTPNRQALVEELATHRYTLEESHGGGLRVTIENPTPGSPWAEPFYVADRGIIADAYELSVGMVKEYLSAERGSMFPQRTWGGKELVNEFGETVGKSDSVVSMAGPYTKSGEGITYAKVATKKTIFEVKPVRAADPVGNMVGSEGEVTIYSLGKSVHQKVSGAREGIFNEDGSITVSRGGTKQSAELIRRENDLLNLERETDKLLGKSGEETWQYPTERVYRETYEVEGDTIVDKAERLTKAIDEMVEERGFADTVSTFGLEPVRAVYPDALQYSLMEKEQALFRQLEDELGVSDPAYRDTIHDKMFQEVDNILRGDKKSETTITETIDGIDYDDYLTERKSGGGGRSKKPLSPEEFDRLNKLAKEIAAKQEKLWTLSPEERAARVATSVAVVATQVKPKPGTKVVVKETVKEKIDTSLSEITPEEIRSATTSKRQPKTGQEQLVDAIGKPVPVTEVAVTTAPVVAPEKIPSPVPNPVPSTVIAPVPNPAPEPIPQPVPQSTPIPVPVPNPTPIPVPNPVPVPVPNPATVTSPMPQIVSVPMGEFRGGFAPLLPGKAAEGKGTIPVFPGTVVWKMGLFWKSLPPDYDRKPKTTKLIPRGAKLTGRTPKETLQVVGGPMTKKTVFVDIGIVTAKIEDYGRRILFFSRGLSTDTKEPEAAREETVRRRVKYTVSTKPKRKTSRSSRSSEDYYMDEVGSFVGW